MGCVDCGRFLLLVGLRCFFEEEVVGAGDFGLNGFGFIVFRGLLVDEVVGVIWRRFVFSLIFIRFVGCRRS